MANDHPFQNLFETLGRVPTAHAETVNRQASEILADILAVPLDHAGRCILLRAPRAGYGKTHLLSRTQHRLGAVNEFIPLHAASGFRIDAATVTSDILRRLVRQLPASGGLTTLDLLVRRLFASSLEPLVSSGEVPSEDRVGALAALRNRPVETFDFHHPYAATAHWAKENFELLSQRLSYELAQRSGQAVREVDFWVGVFFRFSSSALDNPDRVHVLTESILPATGTEMERLEALLGLLTLLVRVVLVADDLEGFSTDETAALRLAAFLGALRHSVGRVDVILSLNDDIWHSAFIPRLSGGLADRLSEIVVELEPLGETEMAALLDSRAPGMGKQLLGGIDLAKSGTHPRGLIRAAGQAWLKAKAPSAGKPVVAATPAPVNAPLVAKPAPVPPPLPEPPASIPVLAPVFEPAPAPAATGFQCPPPLPPYEDAKVSAPAASAPTVTITGAADSGTFATPPPQEKKTPPTPDFSQSAATPEPPDSPFKIVEEKSVAEKPAPSPYEPPPGWIPPKRQPIFRDQQAEVIQPIFISQPAAAAPEATSTPVSAAYFQSSTPVFQAVHEEPSKPQLAPETAVAFAAPGENASQPPETPASPTFQLPPDSPFEIVATEEEPSVAPAPASAPAPAAVPAPAAPSTSENPPSNAAGTDRVDDLLRQFRERYSRGSL
ncbi:hypothetical protein JIN84_14880 [Luteolibacter yonseiensis]|uniref:Uncharacterized protein n=1 Tax=Luteolibacter yonseiensis TaxID=1144680 RepID=A0A934VB56_9BACT|nr:hypothetical protein [Luteolibacter yonseiensis]MBK1816908.1 hypothetical protein [Luteolibacter yonseiensis]